MALHITNEVFMFLVFGFSCSIGVSASAFLEASESLPEQAVFVFGLVRIMASAPACYSTALTFRIQTYVVSLRIEGAHFERFIVQTRAYTRGPKPGQNERLIVQSFKRSPSGRF